MSVERLNQAVREHLDNLLAHGTDTYGRRTTPFWLANLDTRSGSPAVDHVPARTYRQIGAPNGSTLYWDLPLLTAALELSARTGEPKYAAAAEVYVAAFLELCVDEQGLFEWGNHRYWDVTTDEVVRFSGGYHELRPLVPDWDVFWRHDAAATERCLRAMASRHTVDPATGEFNRHDDGKQDMPFLEAGAVLVESLAWLFAKTGDRTLVEQALRLARFSYGRRGEMTGILVNNPTPQPGRWDAEVGTTEIGLWAGSLLRAAELTGEDSFQLMARSAVSAYLTSGWDEENELYFGQLKVSNGDPASQPTVGYWPRRYADPWNTDQWPTHDYPMAMAEAALTLRATGDPIFEEAVRRWVLVIERSLPVRDTYAENYGRVIRFLARAAVELEERTYADLANHLADDAVKRLVENGWLQGFSGSHVYEAVAGVGWLFV